MVTSVYDFLTWITYKQHWKLRKVFIINSRDKMLYRVRFLRWKECLNRFYFLIEFPTSTLVCGVHVPLWAQEGQRAILGVSCEDNNLPCVLRVALGSHQYRLAAHPALQEASYLWLPMYLRTFNVGSRDHIQILSACTSGIFLIGLFP